MFDIAVILINYNSSEHTINCIRSIIEKTSKNLRYQIIITDNCSEKEDYLKLKSFCDTDTIPNLQLHRNHINTGFGGGNMYGAQYANAYYLAFINNDTLLINDCLSILKTTLDANPEIGIAGAQAFKENGDFMISLDHFASPAREIIGRKFLEITNPKKYPKRKKRYTEPVQVNFVPGSFMFVRATDFNAIGGFDTNIFLYYEETDLCIRLANQSKFAYLVPEAEFIHFHGASTERSLAIKKELKISLLYIMRKHYGYFGHKIVLLFLTVKYFFSNIFKPKNWPLFVLFLTGAPLSKSLKMKQRIVHL
ncbi:glycosyltransferase family 2 protein [Flavobacterium sp. GT3R68]|uniref:glycosyltransferase family 2 protein n=1 Tax=Flavobacterium sp. GT3R68 TaxID=2594437 RepID=UPI000F86C410|nr:glycosyltransferase family 2 protein [Flavobacterium sp. GT3R68]RTY92391.1 glycosyltransferase family 2 protein [Flavobacterium sp. GSN2]TRW92307.1 glycosyltransferase family 2 protein [Flavobacterium sp. GT3R68]